MVLKRVTVAKYLEDDNRHVLVLEVDVCNQSYISFNLYNPNTESEQVKTLGELRAS